MTTPPPPHLVHSVDQARAASARLLDQLATTSREATTVLSDMERFMGLVLAASEVPAAKLAYALAEAVLRLADAPDPDALYRDAYNTGKMHAGGGS